MAALSGSKTFYISKFQILLPIGTYHSECCRYKLSQCNFFSLVCVTMRLRTFQLQNSGSPEAIPKPPYKTVRPPSGHTHASMRQYFETYAIRTRRGCVHSRVTLHAVRHIIPVTY